MPVLQTLATASARGWRGNGAVGVYELISTTILASTTTSVTFNITAAQQASYKHLQIRMTGRSTANVNGDNEMIQFNGDSTYTNYRSHYLQGTGSSVVSGTMQSTNFPGITTGNNMADASYASNIFTGAIIDILDAFSTTKNKTVRSLAGSTPNGVALHAIHAGSGMWMNTAAISSVTMITYQSNNWAIGSRFSLYGVR